MQCLPAVSCHAASSSSKRYLGCNLCKAPQKHCLSKALDHRVSTPNPRRHPILSSPCLAIYCFASCRVPVTAAGVLLKYLDTPGWWPRHHTCLRLVAIFAMREGDSRRHHFAVAQQPRDNPARCSGWSMRPHPLGAEPQSYRSITVSVMWRAPIAAYPAYCGGAVHGLGGCGSGSGRASREV